RFKGGGEVKEAPTCRDRTAQPRARFALLLTMDALRSDYFGMAPETRPNIERLRRESVDFVNAHQVSSGTALSIFSFMTGRYPNVATPLLDVRPSLKGLEFDVTPQQPALPAPMTDAQQTDQLIESMRQSFTTDRRFFFHVHYMALHLP